MRYIIGLLTTAVLFLILILILAVKPSHSKKITFTTLAIAGISGLLIHTYGYLAVTENFVLAILKALLATCSSFVGGNRYGDFSSLPVMKTTWMQILCAAIQVCALYTTASAVITSLGTEALKKMRVWLFRRKNIHLIYGVNEDSLNFGRDLISRKEGLVIFVSSSASAATEISTMGSILLADSHAISADRTFLRKIGFHHKRELTLYALEKNATANIHYAQKLLCGVKQYNIAPQQLRLVILGQEESAVSQLQATTDQYGYGFVTAVSEPQMVARLLALHYPPCETVAFDKDAKATEDFNALIIGFGQIGQTVLKTLIMNGQFEGSNFHAAVFAPDCKSADGSFFNQHPHLIKEYDISFYDSNAKSRKIYEYLHEHVSKLKYVAICTGNEKVNHELAEDLTSFFRLKGYSIPTFKCSHKGIEALSADGTVVKTYKLYTAPLLSSYDLDKMAMVLNHRYQNGSNNTALENWLLCDYFSRQSCRAAADFVPAMLRAAGKTREDVVNGDWDLTDTQTDNLSKTEHLRWCAFHYCMGFSPMDNEEFAARADIYRQQLAKDGVAKIRIGKNMTGRTHACLVKWDELDLLSLKEEAITGKYVDYKAMDTENVLAIPQLLQA